VHFIGILQIRLFKRIVFIDTILVATVPLRTLYASVRTSVSSDFRIRGFSHTGLRFGHAESRWLAALQIPSCRISTHRLACSWSMSPGTLLLYASLFIYLNILAVASFVGPVVKIQTFCPVTPCLLVIPKFWVHLLPPSTGQCIVYFENRVNKLIRKVCDYLLDDPEIEGNIHNRKIGVY